MASPSRLRCFFVFMEKFEIDSKGDWYKSRRMLLSAIVNDQTISKEDREFSQRMKDKVIYESPKTYVDGVAYNDGTWVIYETFRTNKGGKLIGNFKIKDLNDLIRRLYGYMVFLKLAGISNQKMLVYFTVVFFDRLVYRKGLFDCNMKNKDILNKLADRVMAKTNEELTKDWTRGKTKDKIGCWDDREFCLETTGMSKSEVSRKRNAILDRKKKLDDQIEAHYDEGKSIRDMLDILHSAGVKIGKSRYCLWLKEHKEGAVQNRPSDDNDWLSKTDHSNEGEAVQNRPSTDVGGCPKQSITIHYIDRNSIGDANPIVEKRKKQTTEQVLSYYSKEEREMIKRHLSYDREIERRKEERTDDFFF